MRIVRDLQTRVDRKHATTEDLAVLQKIKAGKY